jgi:diacylglycerol kinase
VESFGHALDGIIHYLGRDIDDKNHLILAIGALSTTTDNFERCLWTTVLASSIGISMIRISLAELRKKIDEESIYSDGIIPNEIEASLPNVLSKALTYAGWRKSLRERNMKIDSLAAPIVILAGLALGIGSGAWILTLLIIGEIIGGESINTVLEDIADRTTRREDLKIKVSKDLAAGAVLIQAFAALCIAHSFFLPKIMALL